MTVLNISSEATVLIVTKFNVENPGAGGIIQRSRSRDQQTAMPTDSEE